MHVGLLAPFLVRFRRALSVHADAMIQFEQISPPQKPKKRKNVHGRGEEEGEEDEPDERGSRSGRLLACGVAFLTTVLCLHDYIMELKLHIILVEFNEL